jgi:hypothetical protein
MDKITPMWMNLKKEKRKETCVEHLGLANQKIKQI